jgi:predicted RNase H-like HicB family nuclease
MQFSAVIRREGNLLVAWCPEIDVASQGASVEESLANLKEAIELYLEDEDALRPEGTPLIATLEVRDDEAAGAVGA